MSNSFRDVWAIGLNGPTGQSLGRKQYSNLFLTKQKVQGKMKKPSIAVFLTGSLFL